MPDRPTELLLRSPRPDVDQAFAGLAGEPREVLPVEVRVIPGAARRVDTIRPGAARWERRWARELTGQHMVVLGAGSVAGELGPLPGALGLRTTGVSRSGRPVEGLDAVVPSGELDGLLPSADILVVLLPLTEATRGIVSAERLARRPEGSLLVVASRGGIVDEAAALRSVRDGLLRGVAFDVFQEEPLPPGAPHWSEPGVLITPHVAGTTDRFMHRVAGIAEVIWRAAFMDGRDAVG